MPYAFHADAAADIVTLSPPPFSLSLIHAAMPLLLLLLMLLIIFADIFAPLLILRYAHVTPLMLP